MTGIDLRLRKSPLAAALIVLALALCLSRDGEAREGDPPTSWTMPTSPEALVPEIELPAVDRAREAAAATNAVERGPAPLKVGIPHAVSISPDRDGRWEEVEGGGRLWRYRFHAPGATDLNFGFTTFRLPPGATLHVHMARERYHEGPYTSADNKAHGELWTPVVPGDRATIELFVPDDPAFAPALELTRVSAGFANAFDRRRRSSDLPKQGACNVDVVCREGDPWRNEIRSVARLLIDGIFLCTGTLVNDVPGSARSFVLTAAHCEITAGNAPSIVFLWNFDSPTCGRLGGGSLRDTQTGSTFRASRTDVDMALVELDRRPDPAFNVFRAGWDRSGATPLGSVGIHHPRGDEKAISFNFDRLTTIDNCIGFGRRTHWRVDNWEIGTTEVGSSGSGLFDPANRRLIGFLSGGSAACSGTAPNPLPDCYGKFSVAWDGPNQTQRLRDHLDPQNTGRLRIAGRDAGGGLAPPPPPPPTPLVRNDNFADARRLRGRSGRVTGTNVGATAEVGEPAHAVRGGSSVWWRWRAPRSGRVAVQTRGSDFDTTLAAYTGNRVRRLRQVASNDDAPGLGLRSRIRFRAVAGRMYRIAVDGYFGDEGSIVLRYRLRPTQAATAGLTGPSSK